MPACLSRRNAPAVLGQQRVLASAGKEIPQPARPAPPFAAHHTCCAAVVRRLRLTLYCRFHRSSANLPVSMCLYGNLKSVCVRNGTSYTYTYRFSILCMYVHMCMYCMYVYVSEIHNILDTCTYIQIHTIHTHTYFNFEKSRYIHIHTYTYT
jgi:hypothetical protein